MREAFHDRLLKAPINHDMGLVMTGNETMTQDLMVRRRFGSLNERL